MPFDTRNTALYYLDSPMQQVPSELLLIIQYLNSG